MPKLKRGKRLQVLNIISFIGVIVVNGLANLLPINGYQTGEVSELYPNLFTPAGITFSIWGIIYLTLAGFVLYQARGLISKKEPLLDLLKRVGYLFAISCLANIGWLIAWHYLKIKLSLLIMLVLLGSLAAIYRRLDIGKWAVSRKENWFVHLPFSLYTAWITVATLANLTVVLVDLNWYGTLIPAELWTVGLILLAVGAAVYMYTTRGDLYYNLVIIWALLGIIIKRVVIAEQLVASVVLAAGLGSLMIVGNIIYQKLKR